MNSINNMKMKTKYSIYLCLIVVLICSCSTKTDHLWVTTQNGAKLWLLYEDTTKNFLWDGNTIDSVANGNGVLSWTDEQGNEVRRTCNMFFGASSDEDITTMDDGSRYVGALVDNQMEGFGVLQKTDELYVGSFHESKPDGFLNLYKKDSLYYSGLWKAGAFDGEGTLYKEDGTIKTGEWSNGRLTQTLMNKQLSQGDYFGYVRDGKPDGLGIMTYTNGSSYQGKWQNGQWNGEGLYINETDSVYGVWEEGKVNGDVIYRTSFLYYEGTMVDNVPIGVGNLALSDGSYYTGYWLNGKRDGNGDMVFANGDTYSGEWSENQFDGTGTYHYTSENAVYEGEWSKGLQHGNGHYKRPEFSYTGQWDQGWMDGDGSIVFSNGDEYEGTFHSNILDGVGHYEFANGNWYEGEFINGQMNGLGVFQFKNGDRFEGEFVDGKIYGDGTLYLVGKEGTVSITGFWPKEGSFPKEASILFADGDLYEGPIVNGAPTIDGTWVSGEERQQKLDKVNNSVLHKANEFYKKHRETINWCLMGASVVVAVVAAVATAPVAAVAVGVGLAINTIDAGAAIVSATIDVAEDDELGVDNSESVANLATEVSMNMAFILVPKVAAKPLKSGLKYVKRSKAAQTLLKMGKKVAKKSAFKFVGKKGIGKQIRLTSARGERKIEQTLVQSKVTQNPTLSLGRILTKPKHQFVNYKSYLKKLKNNPELKNKLKMSAEGNSGCLGNNLRVMGTNKWVHKNELIKRWLKLPKKQIEAHHVIPANPTTELGRKARYAFEKYFGGVDHPLNGIWLGKGKSGYKSLAKGANHGPNTSEYQDKVAKIFLDAEKKLKAKYPNNPAKISEGLAEVLDNIKMDLYKGKLQIGSECTVHTWWSVLKSDVVKNATKGISNNLSKLGYAKTLSRMETNTAKNAARKGVRDNIAELVSLCCKSDALKRFMALSMKDRMVSIKQITKYIYSLPEAERNKILKSMSTEMRTKVLKTRKLMTTRIPPKTTPKGRWAGEWGNSDFILNDDFMWKDPKTGIKTSVKELKKRYKIKGELKVKYQDGEPVFDRSNCLGTTRIEYKQGYNYKELKDLHNSVNENLSKESWVKGHVDNKAVNPTRDYVENAAVDGSRVSGARNTYHESMDGETIYVVPDFIHSICTHNGGRSLAAVVQ